MKFYLSGGMEYKKNFGMVWREWLTLELEKAQPHAGGSGEVGVSRRRTVILFKRTSPSSSLRVILTRLERSSGGAYSPKICMVSSWQTPW